jgi:hypothetical protein
MATLICEQGWKKGVKPLAKPNLRDTPVPPSPCPWCGKLNDMATSANADRPDDVPEPGDVTVCIACASPAVFNPDMTLRRPWPGEIEAAHPDDRTVLDRAVRAVRQLDRRGLGS